ncbi:MAG: hypothetical protein SNJ77_11985, partial [Cytophagales bacterium]
MEQILTKKEAEKKLIQETPSDTSILVNNISVTFETKSGDDYTAIKDIDLEIKKGEIVCLIGHS